MEQIPGIIDPSDIFTKKMKDNTHFRNIRDSMMVSLQDFLNIITMFPHISLLPRNYFPTIPFGQNRPLQKI